MEINQLLMIAREKNASDLHLSTGNSAMLRIDGELQAIDNVILEKSQLQSMLSSIMTDQQQKQYLSQKEIDFTYTLAEKIRCRVNAFHQQMGPAAAFRCIPDFIPSLDALNIPAVFKDFCHFQNGLVLVTGPTGSGKSTTLAAMMNYLNQSENKHIITIEDPMEFIHQSKNCLINQREIHQDSLSFANALRTALRQDPDIILLGEIRDLDTIRLALTAAETGHLVFASLHTNSAAKTIDRIIDVFPADEKAMVRTMLATSLRAVISQVLLKKITGGRVAAFEIMACTPAIGNLIRENKIAQIYSALQTGQAHQMCTLEQYKQKLFAQRLIANQ